MNLNEFFREEFGTILKKKFYNKECYRCLTGEDCYKHFQRESCYSCNGDCDYGDCCEYYGKYEDELITLEQGLDNINEGANLIQRW